MPTTQTLNREKHFLNYYYCQICTQTPLQLPVHGGPFESHAIFIFLCHFSGFIPDCHKVGSLDHQTMVPWRTVPTDLCLTYSQRRPSVRDSYRNLLSHLPEGCRWEYTSLMPSKKIHQRNFRRPKWHKLLNPPRNWSAFPRVRAHHIAFHVSLVMMFVRDIRLKVTATETHRMHQSHAVFQY